MQNLQGHFELEVIVYPRRGSSLRFGFVSSDNDLRGYFEGDGECKKILSATYERRIQGGNRFAFSIPARRYGQTGQRWSDVIRGHDLVIVNARQVYSPDPDGSLSVYRNIWVGFVDIVEYNRIPTDSGFVEVVNVVTMDSLGLLSREHYAYWRNLGAIFGGAGGDATLVAKLDNLFKVGFTRDDLTANSIAASGKVIFETFIYPLLDFKRQVNTVQYTFEDFTGYLFESDDYAVDVDLSSLAPESRTWEDSWKWFIDSPHFYEGYIENYPADVSSNTLTGQFDQKFYKAPKIKLEANRRELFVVRPLPFPTYDGRTDTFDNNAWNRLKIFSALPTGNISMRIGRGASETYSVFSVDLTSLTGFFSTPGQSAQSQSIVVVDKDKFLNVFGYRPFDAATKRRPQYTYKSPRAIDIPFMADFTSDLIWKTFSYHHFNDIFYAGEIDGPLDLRPFIGSRYLMDGMLFYLEGTRHTWDWSGECKTTFTVSRGLYQAMYGFVDPTRPEEERTEELVDYVKKYLGRKRPGETVGPFAGNVNILDALNRLQQQNPEGDGEGVDP